MLRSLLAVIGLVATVILSSQGSALAVPVCLAALLLAIGHFEELVSPEELRAAQARAVRRDPHVVAPWAVLVGAGVSLAVCLAFPTIPQMAVVIGLASGLGVGTLMGSSADSTLRGIILNSLSLAAALLMLRGLEEILPVALSASLSGGFAGVLGAMVGREKRPGTRTPDPPRY